MASPKWNPLDALSARLRPLVSAPARRWALGARIGAAVVLGAMLAVVVGPFFRDLSTFGWHDWDAHSAYRYITVLCLKRYHELPFWHPYLTGGYPAFGYVEGATNLVSPFLPIYLLSPIQIAVRLEVVGSALIGLSGSYLLASRFTKSAALSAIAAALWALNGRFALQATAGHTWHLQYAWMPWAFYFFDRALGDRRLKYAVYAGATIALMVYMGGVYPVPHTALFLTIYALFLAARTRSPWPLGALSVVGATAVGFSAPKLLPVIDTMRRTPREIRSPEAIGLHQLLVMMTERAQALHARPIAVPIHRWHEYGIYIGWAGIAALLVGLLFARGAREQALKVAGGLALLLGMGSFHAAAPWALLHRLPGFSSQWVPSRFLYSMVLFFAVCFAAAIGRAFDRQIEHRPWLDLLALVPALALAMDIALVGRHIDEDAFRLIKPPIVEQPEFYHARRAVYRYVQPDPQAAPVLLGMFANLGQVEGYGTPLFTGGSSIAKGSPKYRGEAFIAEGPGQARIVAWSPNHAEVDVEGALPGSLLVYNMNFDPSWRAGAEPAIEWNGLPAARLSGGAERVSFRYRPRTLTYGVAMFCVTLAACLIAAYRKNKKG
jgi:hypothetical protein